MIKQEEPKGAVQPGGQGGKKTYTGRDVIEAAKQMLQSDGIGKKLPDDVVEKLSRLLAKNALKGDL